MMNKKAQNSKIKTSCRNCKSIFYAFPSRKRKYCSFQCYWNSLKIPRVKKKCKYCNKKFYVILSRKNKAKFCSCNCLVNSIRRKERSRKIRQKISLAHLGKKRLKDSRIKQSKTLKRLYKEGKLKPWNKLSLPEKKIICMYEKDISGTKIAKQFNCTPLIIYRILKEKGINMKGTKFFNKGKHPKTEYKKGDPRILGKNNPAWKNGVSFEPYSIEFNEGLKEKIRKRDNFTCQECEITQEELKKKLSIHHIDYNKKNDSPLNLISLCLKCHLKTNNNRKHWENYFKMKMFIKELFDPRNILIFNENKQLIGAYRI